MGSEKTPGYDTPEAATMPIGFQTMAYATLVGHRDVQLAAGAILGTHHLISALHWCHHSNQDFRRLAKYVPTRKADQ